MTALIQELIDKKDNFEIIRDKIAQILADESASQVALATTQGKTDTSPWELRVFIERARPWEQFQRDGVGSPVSTVPIVNIWFDRLNFDKSKSNVLSRQQGTGVFNIDVYGYDRSKDTAEGHDPGDAAATFKMQQGVRLIRNILMSGYYAVLGWSFPQQTIGQRFIPNITVFQPEQGNEAVQNVACARLPLEVSFNETSFEYIGEQLEKASVIIFGDDGSVTAQCDYDYDQGAAILGAPEGEVTDMVIGNSTSP